MTTRTDLKEIVGERGGRGDEEEVMVACGGVRGAWRARRRAWRETRNVR